MHDARLAALYQEMILDHFRRPRNKGALPHADRVATIKNPLCGDEISVGLSLDGDAVREIRFSGRGCSIAQASASMMTQLVAGKTREEIAALAERVEAMLRGDEDAASDERLGDLRALAGVARFPVRIKCAMLAWEVLARAVKSEE